MDIEIIQQSSKHLGIGCSNIRGIVVYALEMRCVKGVCDVSSWEEESKNEVYEIFFSVTAKTLASEVSEWVKHRLL